MSDTPPAPKNSPSIPQAEANSSQTQRVEQFTVLVECATDFAIFLLDVEGNVNTWNEGARRILGYEEAEVIGQSTARFYTPEDQAQGIPQRQLQIAREQGRAENERWQMRKDGIRFYASGIDQALRDADGKLRGYSLIFRDQTQHRQMQEMLRLSEERYRRIVESVTEYAIFTLDAQGRISEWNIGAERLLGYRAEEILGQPSSVLFTPEDVAKGEARNELQQAADTGRAEDERWHVKQDGSRFWASGVLMRMHDGEQHRFIKVMRDMTQSKQAEAERSRQQTQIAVLQERNRLAQELHDTLAQGFTGITMQLEAARGLLRSAPEQAEYHFNRATSLARESLAEARRSVQALRPALLQNDALPAALARLVEQVTSGTGVKGEFVQQGEARPLPPAREDDLLRIVQEALTNALLHGHASRVQVVLRFLQETVELRVQDNGQGFDVLAPLPSGHYGLVGMRDRATRLGAAFTIHSQIGQGTEVSVVIADRTSTQTG